MSRVFRRRCVYSNDVHGFNHVHHTSANPVFVLVCVILNIFLVILVKRKLFKVMVCGIGWRIFICGVISFEKKIVGIYCVLVFHVERGCGNLIVGVFGRIF